MYRMLFTRTHILDISFLGAERPANVLVSAQEQRGPYFLVPLIPTAPIAELSHHPSLKGWRGARGSQSPGKVDWTPKNGGSYTSESLGGPQPAFSPESFS